MKGFNPYRLAAHAVLCVAPLAIGAPSLEGQSARAIYRSVSVGAVHACGLRANGDIYCWGNARYGQLGNGIAEDIELGPVRVTSTLRFKAVSAGATHTCALGTDRAAYCWGTDVSGVLGDAMLIRRCEGIPCSAVPTQVGGALRFDAISAGYEHSCALRDGRAFCWGRNEEGQLGRGRSGELCGGINCGRDMVPVMSGSRFTSVSARGRHTCALADGQAFCWGDNGYGQLAAPSTLLSSERPTRVPTSLSFVSLSSGGLHSCALTRGGDVACWGRLPTDAPNGAADRGAISLVPSRQTGTRFIALGAGGTHSCALGANRAVYCWGIGLYNRLGSPPVERCGDLPCSRFPQRVAHQNRFTALSVGGTAACALESKGVACWGGTAREAAVAEAGRPVTERSSP